MIRLQIVALAAILSLGWSSAEAQAPATTPPNILVPQCDTTGVTDCSSLIQSAINQLEAASGGTVELPAGVINTSSGVVFTGGGINYKGQGWEDFSGNFGQYSPAVHGTMGTYVYTSNPAVSPIFCGSSSTQGYQGCNQIVISDMAFIQNQPADRIGWTPTSYAPTIQDEGSSLKVENVLCWGVLVCYQEGSDSSLNAAAGKAYLHHIFCAAFIYCFNIAGATDVVTIDNVHAFSMLLDGSPGQISYIQNHSIVLRSARDDNPMVSNLFAFGYGIGIYFTRNVGGSTGTFQFSNIDIDGFYSAAILTDGSNTTGRFVNFQAQASNDGSSTSILSVPISVTATDAYSGGATSGIIMDMVNVNLNHSGAYAVNISSGSGDYSFVNLRMGSYDLANGGWVGMSVSAGNTVCISGRYQGTSAHGTALNSGITPTYGTCKY